MIMKDWGFRIPQPQVNLNYFLPVAAQKMPAYR